MVSISETEKKVRLSVYIEPELARLLADHAARRDRSRSLVAEAAIASFFLRIKKSAARPPSSNVLMAWIVAHNDWNAMSALPSK